MLQTHALSQLLYIGKDIDARSQKGYAVDKRHKQSFK